MHLFFVWVCRAPTPLETPDEASQQLYDILHRCDLLGVRSIIVLMPPDEPEWRAVRDRLLRATRPLDEIE